MAHWFSAESGSLLIIDLQDRLCAVMDPTRLARVVNRIQAAVEGARALNLPIAVTEQYPKGLGPTLKSISSVIPGFSPVSKLEFSGFVPEVRRQLSPRPNVLVVGMETHVCVFQTVRALKEAGMTPYLARDAVMSRNELDWLTGVELCRDAGAIVTTVETALFDALGKAGTTQFKAISAAVK
jgi:nicotinamidase-related amidase